LRTTYLESQMNSKLKKDINTFQPFLLPELLVNEMSCHENALGELLKASSNEKFIQFSKGLNEISKKFHSHYNEQLDKMLSELGKPSELLLEAISSFNKDLGEVFIEKWNLPFNEILSLEQSFKNIGSSLSPDSKKSSNPSEILEKSLLSSENPEVIICAEIITLGHKTSEGQLVTAVSVPWWKIFEELMKDPHFLYQFPNNARKFEEFIAGAYQIAGWQVELTPRSGDYGRDIIVEKHGFGALRFIDQCKAYRQGHRVTAEEVRALLGVYNIDPKANKGILTTTAEFAPGIYKDPYLGPYLGNRIELRDGKNLISWLSEIARNEYRKKF
jgi:restriction system protein